MRFITWIIITCTGFSLSYGQQDIEQLETGSREPMPQEWIDQDTGYKIIRLSRRQGNNRSFYFHNNPFVPASGHENDKMVFYGSLPQSQPGFLYCKHNRDCFVVRFYKALFFAFVQCAYYRGIRDIVILNSRCHF